MSECKNLQTSNWKYTNDFDFYKNVVTSPRKQYQSENRTITINLSLQ